MGRTAVASICVLVLASAGGTLGASTAAATEVIPGTTGRVGSDGASYGGSERTMMRGNFVVWTGGSGAPESVECPPGSNGRRPWVPAPQRYVDVRSMEVRSLPASVETGVVVVDELDRILDGVALGTRHLCDGTSRLTRIDLGTNVAKDVTTTATLGEYPFHREVVGGELVNLDVAAWSEQPRDPIAYTLTRIDLTTGATRSTRVPATVYSMNDPITRATNGDLYWSTEYSWIAGAGRRPCDGRPQIRRWSSTSGAVTLLRPSLSLRAISRQASDRAMTTCWGAFDPDTGLLLQQRPTWALTPAAWPCGTISWRLRGACDPRTHVSGVTIRCCMRVHDHAAGEYLHMPSVSSGPFQQPIGVGDDALVWETTERYRSGKLIGPIRVTRFREMRPVVEIRNVTRRGNLITVSYRNNGLRKLVNVIRKRPLIREGRQATVRRPCEWIRWGAAPTRTVLCSWDYLVGRVEPGRRGCRGPAAWRPTSRIEDTCLINGPAIGTITFVDTPGRQTYRLDSYGFLSRPLIM